MSDRLNSLDLHSLRELPIVPGEQLGGFRIGTKIGEYEDVLTREASFRTLQLPRDWVRLKEKAWGRYQPPWSLIITISPVTVHVDIRDATIYRVDALPGYEAGYNGIAIGKTWAEAQALEPTIDWDQENDALAIPGTPGLFFGLFDDDPHGPDEYAMNLHITDIGVYDVSRGASLSSRVNLVPDASAEG